jgi:hypothetical protein
MSLGKTRHILTEDVLHEILCFVFCLKQPQSLREQLEDLLSYTLSGPLFCSLRSAVLLPKRQMILPNPFTL